MPDSIATQLEQSLSHVPGVLLAILYGSAATGQLRSDSDIDIAMLLDAPMPADLRISLTQSLSDQLGREVDLLDLHAISGTILKQVLCKGRVVINNDSKAREGLFKRRNYYQSDMKPYVTRTLLERQQRVING